MKGLDKNLIMILACLIISAALSWTLYFKEYHQTDTVDIHRFPKDIKGWTSRELPITEEEYAILETRNVLAREYQNAKGQKLYLLLVYSQSNRKVSHPPEICYTGGGLNILKKERIWLLNDSHDRLEANKLLLEQGEMRQLSFYWFKIGDSFTASYWKQQILMALKSLIGKSSSSALVRVSLTMEEGKESPAIGLAQEFTRLIKPYVLQYLP
ncbi:MAG: EpsI family protein [Candidatus Omnitrophica bacterium]|nr:EpsI family protein [Candidatus Omnitrophota bacterium]